MDQLGFFATDMTPAITVESAVAATPAAPRQDFELAIGNLADTLRAGKVPEKELVAIARLHNIDDIQDAYNVLEGAVVSLVRETPTIDFANELRDRLPAQRRRTERKEALQAFSTPPDLGVLAQQLANPQDGDLQLEPSAGTGMLASTLKGTLLLNEIDRNRRNVLRAVFPDATLYNYDARYIDATLKGDKPTLVIMNPPFSMDLSGDNGAKVGLAHVRAALRLSAPGARVVAILGHNQHPMNVPWDDILGKDASLRIAVNFKGTDYYRMGTTFGVCLVVIDKQPEMDTVINSTDELPVDQWNLLPILPRLKARRLQSVGGTRSTQGGVARSNAFVPIFNDVTELAYRYEPPTQQEELGKFVRYAATLHFENSQPHPANLVESKALGGVKLPPIDPPSVPVKLSGAAAKQLSNIQLESLAYVRRAWQRTVRFVVDNDDDTGEKQVVEFNGGILVGHGTGFGKGRLMASAILSEMIEGNRIALYFSENQSLFEDFLRDWSDTAGQQYAAAVHNLSSFSANDKIGLRAGIVYSTYATLRVKEKQNTRSRVQQLTEELGTDFAGVIVFDECHNLSNTMGTKGSRGKTDASQQGLAALALQRAFPKAKIIYVSATCASSVEAYAYAERLGLWGINAPFDDRGDFMRRMESGGVGALELLTRDLKAQGLYLATGLSMEGVTVERITHELTAEQIEQYNAVARGWRIIYEHLDEIVREQDNASSRSARAAIASARQRSLQAMLGSLSMPTVLQDMRDKLDRDFSIVGQLTHTYESAQEAALAQMEEGDDLDAIDVSPKQVMLDYLDRVFPVAKTFNIVVEDKLVTNICKDELDRIIEDPDLVAIRDDLKLQISSAIIPDSIMTIMLEEFTPELTAEISGRKRRLVRQMVNGLRKRIIEQRSANANIDETHAFMNGKKRILIFTEAAGGTGRSYNASVHCANQQTRAHYLLEAGWRSDRAIQGFGRTLRSASVSDPFWIMCETNAPGQKRFISTLARRIETLGATSRGQRDAAGTGLFSAEDNLETEYGSIAVRDLLADIAYKNSPISYTKWLEQTNAHLVDNEGQLIPRSVPHFLNYVLSCDLGVDGNGPQNILMNGLLERIEGLVARAKENGTFDFGLRTVRALTARVTDSKLINTSVDGAETYVTTIVGEYTTTKHGFSAMLRNVRNSRQTYGAAEAGFRKDDKDRIFAYYRTAGTYTGGTESRWYTSAYPDHMEYDNFAKTGTAVTEDEAVDLWAAALEAIGETYEYEHRFITGAVLPIIRLLPGYLNAMIANTVTGERVLGIELTMPELQHLFQALELGDAINAESIVARIMKGAVATYDNTTTLQRVHFGHEKRIEIKVPPYAVSSIMQAYQAAGIDCERVNYAWRFFLPVRDTVAAFEAAFGNRKLTALT